MLQRIFFLIVLIYATRCLVAQPQYSLIVMHGKTNAPELLDAETERLRTELNQFFTAAPLVQPGGLIVYSVTTISPAVQAGPDDLSYSNLQEGLDKLREVGCAADDGTTVLAFLFPAGDGPAAVQVHNAIKDCPNPPRLLANAYFRSHLQDLACSRYTVFQYARGVVTQDEEELDDESKFPIIPVAIGTAVGTGAVLLLTGGDDDSPCTAVAASWTPPAVLCADDNPVQLPVTGTSGGTWSGNGVNAQGVFDPSSGTQQVTYTVGEGECRRSSAQTVPVTQENAGWQITGGNTTPCEGQPITLTPDQSGGDWTGSGVTTNPDGTASFSQESAGSYDVTYTISQSACPTEQTQSITVVSDANAAWTPPDDVCTSVAVTLAPDGDPGGTWSGQGVADNGNGTASFESANEGTFSVTYTAGEGECQSAESHDIQVDRTPDASWTAPSGLCAGESTMLTSAGDPGGTWSGTGVTDLGDGTAEFNGSISDSYEVTYTVVNGPCTAAQTEVIEVVETADVSWQAPADVCSGASIILTPDGTPGGTWSGEGLTDLGDGTARFEPPEGGEYHVTYTAGQGTCRDSLAQTISVIQTPDASWTPAANSTCAGDTLQLAPSGTTGGTWSGDGVTDLGDGTAVFSSATSGEYSITYTVSNGPCEATQSQTVSVVDQPDPGWQPPDAVCAGDEVVLTPTGTPGGIWSGSGVTDNGDGTATFTAPEAGDYEVTYTVGQGECAASSTEEITVSPLPDASWTTPGGICTGEEVLLVGDGAPGGTWTGPGVVDNGDGTALFMQVAAGSYPVTYSVTEGACTAASTDTVVVVDLADASWSVPQDVCAGQEVTLVPDGTPGGIWSGDGVTDHGDGTATFLNTTAGTYTVTYTAGQGACQASANGDIVVLDSGDPSWTPPAEPLCPGDVYDLVAPEGDWSGPNVTNMGDGLGTFTSDETGVFTVTLTTGEGTCMQSESHDIEVADEVSPQITTPAQDLTLECVDGGNEADIQAWLDSNGGAGAEDNCNAILIWENDYFGVPFDCGMAGSVAVTFTASDAAGNTSETFAILSIEDNLAPDLEGVPADAVVPCDNIPPPADVTALDQCSGIVNVVFTEETIGADCPVQIRRTWTAVDDCGNETVAIQVIDVIDDAAPVETFVPEGMEILCPGPPADCVPPVVDAEFTDNCDPSPVIEFFEEFIEVSPTELMVLRCWTAVDACGNLSEQVCQNIFIVQEGNLAPSENDGPAIELIAYSFLPPPVPAAGLIDELESVDWHDPGQTLTSLPAMNGLLARGSNAGALRLAVRVKKLGSISISAVHGSSPLFYSTDNSLQSPVVTGVIQQLTGAAELRITPLPSGRLFVRSGVGFIRQNAQNLSLHRDRQVNTVTNDITFSEVGLYTGLGMTFPLPPFGEIELSGAWSGQKGYGEQLFVGLSMRALFHALKRAP